MPPLPKKPTGPFARDRCAEPPPEALRHGIAEFNRGEFFEQHETLELLWRAEPHDVRYLYQGILLVGVGFYHLSRGNHYGAVRKLARGLELLRWFEPACQGVDVTRLTREAQRCLDDLHHLGPANLATFDWSRVPCVHYVDAAPP